MPTQPERARPSVGGAILGGILKLGVVALIIGSVVGLIMYGGVSPDQHGIKHLRAGKPVIGAWLGEWPSDDNDIVQRFQQQAGTELDIVDVFMDWYTPAKNVTHTVKHIASHGAVAMLTWEPHGFTTADILDGSKPVPLRDGRTISLNAYMNEFADVICDAQRESGQPVIMRVMHEMNGNWYSWGISYEKDGARPNSDASFRDAWRKLHGFFDRHCDLTLWMWALNHVSVGQGATLTGHYPGDAYVDYVGIDGYNWGDNAVWGWQDFDTLFSQAYCEVRAKIPSKPIVIAETASTEFGGSKELWIQDLFETLAYEDYPGLLGFIYFNFAKYEVEIEGNMDWPVDSSPGAVAAFEEGAKLLERARLGDRLPERPPDEFGQPVRSGPRC